MVHESTLKGPYCNGSWWERGLASNLPISLDTIFWVSAYSIYPMISNSLLIIPITPMMLVPWHHYDNGIVRVDDRGARPMCKSFPKEQNFMCFMVHRA